MEKRNELNGDESGECTGFTGEELPSGRQCSWIPHASSGALLEQVLDVLDYGNCQDSIGSGVRVIMKA